MSNMIQLPVSGDLWIPPEYDAEGNIKPREDNIAPDTTPKIRMTSPDVAALAMAELARVQNEAAKPAPAVGLSSKA